MPRTQSHLLKKCRYLSIYGCSSPRSLRLWDILGLLCLGQGETSLHLSVGGVSAGLMLCWLPVSDPLSDMVTSSVSKVLQPVSAEFLTTLGGSFQTAVKQFDITLLYSAILRSQNHVMVWIGKVFKDHLVLTCHRLGHFPPGQVAQSHIQPCLVMH